MYQAQQARSPSASWVHPTLSVTVGRQPHAEQSAGVGLSVGEISAQTLPQASTRIAERSPLYGSSAGRMPSVLVTYPAAAVTLPCSLLQAARAAGPARRAETGRRPDRLARGSGRPYSPIYGRENERKRGRELPERQAENRRKFLTEDRGWDRVQWRGRSRAKLKGTSDMLQEIVENNQ